MQALQIDTVYEFYGASELADSSLLIHHTSSPAPRILKFTDSTTRFRKTLKVTCCQSFMPFCLTPVFSVVLLLKIAGEIGLICFHNVISVAGILNLFSARDKVTSK